MWLSYLTMSLLLVVGILLIIVVLLQRGRGGGLAGALGGMGGQSAFGTKAGDVFTRITIVIAVIWVVLAGVSGFALRADANRLAERVADRFEAEDADADGPPISTDAQPRSKSPAPEQPKGEKESDAPAQPETKRTADEQSAPLDQTDGSPPADAETPDQ